MKNPDRVQDESGRDSHNTRRDSNARNPRQVRALLALLQRPQARESIDRIAGAANGPALIADLRKQGFDIPCERVPFIDCDGVPCRPGVYSLSMRDRFTARRWLARGRVAW